MTIEVIRSIQMLQLVVLQQYRKNNLGMMSRKQDDHSNYISLLKIFLQDKHET